MKRLVLCSLLLAIGLTGAVQAETAKNILLGNPRIAPYDLSAVPQPWRSNANIFFVDSGSSYASDVADGRHGESWEYPLATIDYAIGRGTAGDWNLILVAPGHDEDVDSDDGVDVDVAGTCIYFVGEGDLRGSMGIDDINEADIHIDADNCALIGARIINEVEAADDSTGMLTAITISGDNTLIRDCTFSEGGTGGDANGTSYISIGVADNDADGTRIIDCTFTAYDTTNWAQAIDFVKDMKNVTIKGCKIYGDFSEAGIDIPAGGNAQVALTIEGCEITNTETGDHAIQANGTGNKGVVRRCALITDGTYVDAGGLQLIDTVFGTYGTDSDVPLDTTMAAIAAILVDTSTTLDDYIDTEVAAILADTEELQPAAEKVISKEISTITNADHALFVVAGGPIKITELVAYVTTEIGAEGNLVCYNMAVTSPAGDVDIGTDGTAMETNGDAVGTVYLWDGVLAADLTPVTAGVTVAMGTDVSYGLIVPAGTLELACANDGSVDGAITVYMRYLPLSTSSAVTAAP